MRPFIRSEGAARTLNADIQKCLVVGNTPEYQYDWVLGIPPNANISHPIFTIRYQYLPTDTIFTIQYYHPIPYLPSNTHPPLPIFTPKYNIYNPLQYLPSNTYIYPPIYNTWSRGAGGPPFLRGASGSGFEAVFRGLVFALPRPCDRRFHLLLLRSLRLAFLLALSRLR